MSEKLNKLRQFLRPVTEAEARASMQRYEVTQPDEPAFVPALENEMREEFLGRVVKGIAPAPASRKISFAGSTMERAQATPPYSEQAVTELANSSKSRFPSLRECDL